MITRKNSPRKISWMWLTLLAGAAIFVCANWSQVSAQTKGRKAPELIEGQDIKVYTLGTQISIDRKTGRLRPPTPEEKRALLQGMQKLLNRSGKGLTVERHSNGSRSINLQGRFMSLSVAKTNPDGTLATECVTTPGEAAKFLGVENGQAAKPRRANKKSVARRSTKKANQASR